jgi:hypothetical protein
MLPASHVIKLRQSNMFMSTKQSAVIHMHEYDNEMWPSSVAWLLSPAHDSGSARRLPVIVRRVLAGAVLGCPLTSFMKMVTVATPPTALCPMLTLKEEESATQAAGNTLIDRGLLGTWIDALLLCLTLQL